MYYGRFIPILNVLFPQIQTISSLSIVDHIPYQSYVLSTMLATQTL